jgi:hypothetical protein
MRVRLTRLATNLATGLVALGLAIGQPVFANCRCESSQADCPEASLGCSCGKSCGTNPGSCRCVRAETKQSAEQVCSCTSPADQALPAGAERSAGPRTDYSFMPAYALLPAVLSFDEFARHLALADDVAGGPRGMRLHALFSVWRN